jgi:hypothetical protein
MREDLLRHELNVLQRSSRHLFSEPVDQALADVFDWLRMGGNEGRVQDEGRRVSLG